MSWILLAIMAAYGVAMGAMLTQEVKSRNVQWRRVVVLGVGSLGMLLLAVTRLF